MNVPAWASRHTRSILSLLLALAVGGFLAAKALPVSLFPHVNFPRIRVNLDVGDRPAERMELDVTRPVEVALRSIPGVRSVESTTSRGSAEVSLTFEWGADMTAAYLQSQAEVARLLTSLPKETTFEIRRMDPTVFPVIAYSLTSRKRPLTELHDIAQFQLQPALSKVEGVAKASVDGAATEEIHVVVSPERLAAYDLSLSDINSALASANVISAVGRLEQDDKLYLVIASNQVTTLEQIRNTVLKTSTTGLAKISDVAEVQLATTPQRTRSTADGQECVLVNVYQQPGGNTVQIAADIRTKLAELQKRLPKDVTIANWYDQSDLINASASGVLDAVLVGIGLAALVLLLFLRDWRMTLVAMLSVPVVLAITALLLYTLGQSFNVMTLGGMAAAVGLIIDDAIVMSEHIVRRLHETIPTQSTVNERVIVAATEFTQPLAGSSLSTIIIHIPPAFLVGVFGAFFAALSLSMAASLIISFFVAWLVIPIVAARVLKIRPYKGPGRLTQSIDRGYRRLMRLVLPNAWSALLVLIPMLAAGYLAYARMPSGVIPTIDEGGFVIDYVGPPGASLTEMDRLLNHVELVLQNTVEVQTYSRRTGFSLGGDISETNTGDFFVRLKHLPRRPINEIMEDIRGQVEHTVPGLALEPAQLMEDLLGDLTGRPQPVVVNLFGDDERALTSIAPQVAKLLSKVDGLSSVENGVVPAGDALQISIDPIKAAIEGIAVETATQSLNDLLEGNIATRVQRKLSAIGVRVCTALSARSSSEGLASLRLRAPDGHLVPLGRIARFETLPGQPEITRLDLQRVIAVTARSSRDLGTTVRDVKALLDTPGILPSAITYSLGGQYEEQQTAIRGTIKVVIAAAALVFLLLLVLYEHLRVAIAILLTTATALAAVLVGLRLTGTEFNISSMMGMVMIVGNVTEVAIFYYSDYSALAPTDSRHENLITAGTQRLRAITMTTLAAILALLPLAIDVGHSAGMLQPLAVAIIAGLAVQLPLVLVLLPVLLSLFNIDGSNRPTLANARTVY